MRRPLLALWILLAILCPPTIAQMMQDIVNGNPIAGVVGCSQATTYLARTSGGNEGGNGGNVTTLICGLVTDGVITGNLSTTGCGSTLDALYVFAQQNSTDALLNICGTNYTATLAGSPTFTTLTGFSGFTTTAYVHTNFNASTATTPNYTQNSANYGLWSKAVVSETNAIMGTGVSAAVGTSNMYNDYTGSPTLFYGRINSIAGSATSVSQPGSKGLFVAERASSASTTLYWDGASAGTVTDASGAPQNAPFNVGFVGGAAASGQTICEAHLGAALSTLNLALYTRLRTYMTAVGVP